MAQSQRPLTRHARKKSQTAAAIVMGLAFHFGAGRAVGGYGLPPKEHLLVSKCGEQRTVSFRRLPCSSALRPMMMPLERGLTLPLPTTDLAA